MKKITLTLLTAFLLLTIVPTSLKAETGTTTTSMVPGTTVSPEANTLLSRLNVIKAMDKSKLSASEKKELRKEVRSTKKKLKELTGGVYLSVGAVILIVILLIILL